MNKHIITLTGDLVAGKGTVSNLLKEKLGYEIYRNGEYARGLARDMNMTIKEFNIYVEKHPDIDIQIEKSASEYAEKNDNLIIDARLGWYAVPHSFKVYLKVDIDEAAKRVCSDKTRGKVESYCDIENAKNELIERFNLENRRFYNLYKVKRQDLNNYDLVIDTTNLTPEEVVNKLYNEYIKFIK